MKREHLKSLPRVRCRHHLQKKSAVRRARSQIRGILKFAGTVLRRLTTQIERRRHYFESRRASTWHHQKRSAKKACSGHC